jgi:hypothetical protein
MCGQKPGTSHATPAKTQPLLPPVLGELLSVEIQAGAGSKTYVAAFAVMTPKQSLPNKRV